MMNVLTVITLEKSCTSYDMNLEAVEHHYRHHLTLFVKVLKASQCLAISSLQSVCDSC